MNSLVSIGFLLLRLARPLRFSCWDLLPECRCLLFAAFHAANYRSQLILYLFTIFLHSFPPSSNLLSFLFRKFTSLILSHYACMSAAFCLHFVTFGCFYFVSFRFLLLPSSLFFAESSSFPFRTNEKLSQENWVNCIISAVVHLCHTARNLRLLWQSVSQHHKSAKKEKPETHWNSRISSGSIWGTNFYVVQNGILGDEKKTISLSLHLYPTLCGGKEEKRKPWKWLSFCYFHSCILWHRMKLVGEARREWEWKTQHGKISSGIIASEQT